jgi:hypothetical protein
MKTACFSRCAPVLAVLLMTACTQREISFKADIQPILKRHCEECHLEGGLGQQKSGLLLSSYESLMKGTRFGPVVKPGDNLTSTLVMLVEGRADPSIKMPHNRQPLSKEEIALVRAWVEQGARNN